MRFWRWYPAEFLFFEHQTIRKENLQRSGQVWSASLLCVAARNIDLGEYLLLGKGEEATGEEREILSSDAMEALIGGDYLDGGFASAKEFYTRFIFK